MDELQELRKDVLLATRDGSYDYFIYVSREYYSRLRYLFCDIGMVAQNDSFMGYPIYVSLPRMSRGELEEHPNYRIVKVEKSD